MSYIDSQELLQKTNGGLTVILAYYPQAEKASQKPNEKFKIREEKTASCTLKLADDGNWIVTDWGDDGKGRNAIQVVMTEDGVDFKQALSNIATRFGIDVGAAATPMYKADIDKRDATPEEVEGETYFDINNDPSDAWLKVLGPYVKPEHLQFLRWKAINSYTKIKNRKATDVKSNETYPMFIIEEEGFKKIYQPNNPEKKYRFQYTGKRPKNFIHGLLQLTSKQDMMKQEYLDQSGAEDSKKKEPKLPEVIMCSGDRDALNVHSLGYHVVWKNSESAKIDGKQYRSMAKICDDVYNIPDLDATGIKQGTALALQYLDMKTIWLPRWLLNLRDWRGNPYKDVTDLVGHTSFKNPRTFKDLYEGAITARFWDESHQMKDGKYLKTIFKFNNVQGYYFLNLNGFWRLPNKNMKSGYMFIHIVDNLVKEVDPVEIKNFVNKFLDDRRQSIQLRNMIYMSTQLDDKSLNNILEGDVDFSDFDRNSQFLFFENEIWEVNSNKIIKHKPGESNKFVWDDEVIPHKAKILEDFFKVTRTEIEGAAEYDIDILNNECKFFKYLINTSRVHWRKELEVYADGLSDEHKDVYLKENRFTINGKGLNDDEVYEQKVHLINKIYSIGYLMHRYKDPSRPWCVFAMDNKISTDGESHGGSGKSICYGSLRKFMKSVTLNGRNRKLTENPHIFENVTEHTDYIFVDDANRYIDFQFFFMAISGDLDVNPKNNRQYSIPFEDSGKFVVVSNFTLRNIDPSTERRLLYTVFSDFYHYNTNDEYREHRDPRSDLGKNLFHDFTDEEWNQYFNFIAQCIRMYLRFPKIDPPMNNVTRRNLIAEMTDIFKNWADVYFTNENSTLDIDVNKTEAFETFKKDSGAGKFIMNRFSKSLKAWCLYYQFNLNPPDVATNKGRIIKNIESKSVEYVHIRTRTVPTPGQTPEENNAPIDEEVF